MEEKTLQEGLWMSPQGEKINVTEHLEAIRNHPEKFGLKPIKTNDLQELRNIAVQLIKTGWIRYRQFELTFFFEVNSVDKSKNLIENILNEVCQYPQYENVEISQLNPVGIFKGTVEQFRKNQLNRTAKEQSNNLIKWAFGKHL